LLKPFENPYVDLPNKNLGDILQSIANRKGELLMDGDFLALLGTACGMIGMISFFSKPISIFERD
jgi:predicted membrane GTPase involved in stress response